VIAGDCPKGAKYVGVVIRGDDINTYSYVFGMPLFTKLNEEYIWQIANLLVMFRLENFFLL
jgi:hypothetical protein